ncbi:MAG: hypothetical protein ACYDHX_07905 [Methanothrix sp.]
MSAPLVRLVLSKEGSPEVGPIKIAFHFNTDIGRFDLKGSGTLKELCEMLPIQIQNAGALRRLLQAASEEQA